MPIHGAMMEMEVKIDSTNLANMPTPQIPMYSNE
jgi:hypothetical protein